MKKLAVLLCIVLALSTMPIHSNANAEDVAVNFVQEFVGVHDGEDIYRLVLSVSSSVPVFLAGVVLSFYTDDIQPVASGGFADIHPTPGGSQNGMFRPLQVLGTNGNMISAISIDFGTDGWVIGNGRSTVAYSLTYLFPNMAAGQQQLFAFYYRVTGSKDADTFKIVDFSQTQDSNIQQMSDYAGIVVVPGSFAPSFYWGHTNSANSNIPASNVALTYTNSHVVRRILQSVCAGGAISGVPNGTPAGELGLPVAVRLITIPPLPVGDDTVNVAWDTTAYSPASEAMQTFDATGTIVLPLGVRDPNGIAADISVSVTVNEIVNEPPTDIPTDPTCDEPTNDEPTDEPTMDKPTEPPTDKPTEIPTTPPTEPPTSPPTLPSTESVTEPSSEPYTASPPPKYPTPPLTVPVNGDAVRVAVHLSRGGTTATITLSAIGVNEVIETSANTIVFNISTLHYATTVVLPRAAVLNFANAELGIKFLLPQGYIYFSAEEVYTLVQTSSGNISFPLAAQPELEPAQEIDIEYTTTLPYSSFLTMRFTIGSTNFTSQGVAMRGDAAPFICYTTGYTMLPLRVIAETLGAIVNWCYQTYTVHLRHNGQEFSITIGEPLPSTLGIPVIVNGRTFVPAAYIAEVFGTDIYWCQATSVVYVQKAKEIT